MRKGRPFISASCCSPLVPRNDDLRPCFLFFALFSGKEWRRTRAHGTDQAVRRRPGIVAVFVAIVIQMLARHVAVYLDFFHCDKYCCVLKVLSKNLMRMQQQQMRSSDSGNVSNQSSFHRNDTYLDHRNGIRQTFAHKMKRL